MRETSVSTPLTRLAALVDEVVNIDVDAEIELEVKNVEKVAFWLSSAATAKTQCHCTSALYCLHRQRL
jgi:hypothetical protein